MLPLEAVAGLIALEKYLGLYIDQLLWASCLDSYDQKGFDTLPNTIRFPKGCSRHGINEFLVSGLLSIFITLQSYSRYVLSR